MVESAGMRRLGLDFSGRQLLFGILAGIVTGILLAFLVHLLAGITDPSANLLAGEGLLVQWAIWVAVTGLAGGVFSLFVATRSYGKAAGWGVLYGALVWATGVMLVLHWLMGMPARVGRFEILNFVGHALWGVGLALAYTWMLNAFAPEVAVERRYGRPAH